MTHWLAIANRDNAAVIEKKLIWGVSKRYVNQITKTGPGDTLLVYVGWEVVDRDTTLPPAITGCFAITSVVYEDRKKIFTLPPGLGNEVFPLRVRLTLIEIFDPPLEFKPLIPRLAFITNKKQWSGHIRGQAMRTIPEEDYAYIMKAAETPRD
ncbi:EVE domain-containing protein [Methanofollis formosanus]|uniref:EVE domain-containing protein n=1 Tax=Methanofollis formosanus TaxID=299308 RepID=A0A8G1A565_9EURY|nr:EVE domain-containing protein [Methanofollis formosanus]QYZ80292.1 EVE domain-containing protein [Methanofollis formosanus]